MSIGILSTVIQAIDEAQMEARAEQHTMVNVRPGEKVSSMLDLVAELSGKSATGLVSEALSSHLQTYAAASFEYADSIMEAAEQALKQDGMLQPGSALELLEKADVITVQTGLKDKRPML
ncbi:MULTISPECIES: hypothetical protein [Halomonadaceae]|jgi:hypothetical protein|uniref:Uncharacterized protein n=2 Tax=Vreelandella TaxID=3137766 RepID=A0A7Z0LY62_9GAMM|nr:MULTISPECIES: hypothetical protein [Halomonas]NYS80500.1 hypothetical protein [Halomonas glaciei]|tara:strand:- start:3797 stop:4156 length:360 start_codon:yes stop_codon:yes gene_type:complete